ncbi:MAG: hypothetical protein NWS47_02125 [Alphaproteobacteria bacterium]|nr:hypothetical protein [Alphaproteobacteria bacterium]
MAPKIAPTTISPILPPIEPAAPFVTFVPTGLPKIDFKSKSTTIQPLAEAYQIASIQATSTQPAQLNDSLTNQLQKANKELELKHKKEYDNVIKDNIELQKEKESVLIQLQAQLKLQLEAQKFAAQQRARAIKEMQGKLKLKLEEEKSKKEAEEMKLNVQSIVDLSPLVLNVNQPKEKQKDASRATEFDFTKLKKVQKAAKKCKKENNKNKCGMLSKYCSWGRVPKQKKHKCLFMCEKLSKNHCKKTSGCFFKNHKCRNK